MVGLLNDEAIVYLFCFHLSDYTETYNCGKIPGSKEKLPQYTKEQKE